MASFAQTILNRKYWLRQYDISQQEFTQLFAFQDNQCACCAGDDPKGNWCVDHNHVVGTHAVRGILCARCNTVLALLGDSLKEVELMQWLLGVRYLRETSPKIQAYLKQLKTQRNARKNTPFRYKPRIKR